jgi:hypothetical protein
MAEELRRRVTAIEPSPISFRRPAGRIALAAYGIAILSSPSIAESPYESAAKVDMEQLASSILAASVCKGAQFHGDAVIASVAAAMVLIGRKGAEESFFSAIRATTEYGAVDGSLGIWRQNHGGELQVHRCTSLEPARLFSISPLVLVGLVERRREGGVNNRGDPAGFCDVEI